MLWKLESIRANKGVSKILATTKILLSVKKNLNLERPKAKNNDFCQTMMTGKVIGDLVSTNSVAYTKRPSKKKAIGF